MKGKMPRWNYTCHDNGGGSQSFSVAAKDHLSAVSKAEAKARKKAKGDITSWDCHLRLMF